MSETDLEFAARLHGRGGPQESLKLGNVEFEYDEGVHGWLIKKTDTYRVDVCILLYHFRLTIGPLNVMHGWDHGWCYSDPDDPKNDLFRAVVAGYAWNPDTEAEPFGWTKRACHERVLA